jgi:predicted ester cyclase
MIRQLAAVAIAWLAAAASGTAAADAAFGCTADSRARNAATVRVVFEEILGKGRIDENEHIYHPDFRARGMTRDATRAEDRAASEGWRSMAPDLQMKVLHLVSDCDYVAAHFEGSGTNTGEGNGFPATGRTIRVRGMTIFRLVDGRIIEEWSSFDQYALLQQLGLVGQ